MNIITGGPMRDFKEGWAVIPFLEKAHYWNELESYDVSFIGDGGQIKFYDSLCGIEHAADSKRPAIDPGAWPKCKRCLKISGKMGEKP